MVSIVSFDRGRGWKSWEVVVALRCSGVLGRIQGSDKRNPFEVNSRCELL